MSLKVFYKDGNIVTDSRDVAEMVSKRHSDLLESIRGYIKHLTNGKFRSLDFFIEGEYVDNKGEKQPCYLLTRKGCDMVANKMTGEKGVLFTATYVTKFEDMEKALRKSTDSYMIEDPIERANAWIKEQKEKKKLAEQNKLMAPKAEFYDAVAGSPDAIAMKDVAKILNMRIGRNNLFKFLRNNKVLMNNNQPYQKYMDAGYFRVIEQKYTLPNGDTKIRFKTLVYQKGLDYIRKLLIKNGYRLLRLKGCDCNGR